MPRQPLIGVTACSREIGPQTYHIAGDRYLCAVALEASGAPLVNPVPAGLPLDSSLPSLEYQHHEELASAPGTQRGPLRDNATLSRRVHQVGGCMSRRELGEQLREIQVNSMHGQGIERRAPSLRLETLAPDGLVDAFSVEDAKSFALGMQWYLERQVRTNPNYPVVLQVVGEACRSKTGQY